MVRSAVTGSNGEAQFSFMQGESYEPYKKFYVNWAIFFDGDNEFNPSHCGMIVLISNNGLPWLTPMPYPPLPTPSPSPIPTVQ